MPKTSMPTNAKLPANSTITPKPNTIIAYTDGACKGNPGDGGWGAYLIESDGSTHAYFGGESNTTNNRMEMLGAIHAIEQAFFDCANQNNVQTDAQSNHQLLELWTDSSYLKNGITKWIDGWKARGWKTSAKKPVKNQDLWQRLDALNEQHNIDWQWIKGHAGHEGNEKADELANQGVSDPAGNINNAIAPTTDLKKNTNNMTMIDNTNNLANNQTNHSNQPDNNNQIHTPTQSHHTPTQSQMPNPYNNPYDGSYQNPYQTQTNKVQATEEDWMTSDILGFDDPNDDLIDDLAIANDIEHQAEEHNSLTAINNTELATNTDQNTEQNTEQTDSITLFDGDTSRANPHFRPLLPTPTNQNRHNRQLIMDTETTGFEYNNGDRVIEVGIVEMVGRKFTGEKLHVYINPAKKEPMSEEVIRVHGITDAFLADKPKFKEVAKQIYDFMAGAEIIAHNASFDMNFLDMEFNKAGLPKLSDHSKVTDSLALAKHQYPGQRNTLDALVKRLNVGKQDRTFHGALLDAEILAEVYLAMTGGQVSLAIDEEVGEDGDTNHEHFAELASMLIADDFQDTLDKQDIVNIAEWHPYEKELKALQASLDGDDNQGSRDGPEENDNKEGNEDSPAQEDEPPYKTFDYEELSHTQISHTQWLYQISQKFPAVTEVWYGKAPVIETPEEIEPSEKDELIEDDNQSNEHITEGSTEDSNAENSNLEDSNPEEIDGVKKIDNTDKVDNIEKIEELETIDNASTIE